MEVNLLSNKHYGFRTYYMSRCMRNDPSGEKNFLVENVERQKWLLEEKRNAANPRAPIF